MIDFFNTKTEDEKSGDFPLTVKNVTNPNWLFSSGQPSHWEVCDYGGTVTVTPKFGGK